MASIYCLNGLTPCSCLILTAQWGKTIRDRVYGAVSVDDGRAVVLVGGSYFDLLAIKLDSGGNKLWEWRVSWFGCCSYAWWDRPVLCLHGRFAISLLPVCLVVSLVNTPRVENHVLWFGVRVAVESWTVQFGTERCGILHAEIPKPTDSVIFSLFFAVMCSYVSACSQVKILGDIILLKYSRWL